MADFWTNASLEPKRKYRFLVTIGEMPNGAQFYAKKATKPKFEISETPHKYINHTFKYPGRTEWQDVEITLVDPVSPDASQHLTAIVESAGYIIPRNENQITTMSKREAVRSLGQVKIRQLGAARGAAALGGGNAPVQGAPTVDGEINDDLSYAQEIWTLNNAWIKSVDFGDLDYESDDLSEITLTLTYDWATLKTGNGLENKDLENRLTELDRSLIERWKLNS